MPNVQYTVLVVLVFALIIVHIGANSFVEKIFLLSPEMTISAQNLLSVRISTSLNL